MEIPSRKTPLKNKVRITPLHLLKARPTADIVQEHAHLEVTDVGVGRDVALRIVGGAVSSSESLALAPYRATFDFDLHAELLVFHGVDVFDE